MILRPILGRLFHQENRALAVICQFASCASDQKGQNCTTVPEPAHRVLPTRAAPPPMKTVRRHTAALNLPTPARRWPVLPDVGSQGCHGSAFRLQTEGDYRPPGLQVQIGLASNYLRPVAQFAPLLETHRYDPSTPPPASLPRLLRDALVYTSVTASSGITPRRGVQRHATTPSPTGPAHPV